MVDFEKGHAVRMAELERTSELATNSVTLRDYFAAKAMQGFVGSSRLAADVTDPKLAEAAYLIADAMMRERTRQDQKTDLTVEEAFGL